MYNYARKWRKPRKSQENGQKTDFYLITMKANIKEIRKATENLMLAPTHSGLVFRRMFGDEAGMSYWGRMARACRDIEAACVKLDELNAEMLEHAKRIEREQRAQERAQAKKPKEEPKP